MARLKWLLAILLMLAPSLFMGSCAGLPFLRIGIQIDPLCIDNFNPGDSADFTACVFFDDVLQPQDPSAVSWSVVGGDVNGTITQDGHYVAPNTNPPPAAQIIILATSTDPENEGQSQGQTTIIFVGNGTCETTANPQCP